VTEPLPSATDPVVVRDLVPGDLEALLAIENVAFTTPWRRETFESLFTRVDTDLLAAERDGRLVGYAICWTIVDQSELGNLAVTPECRGEGIGRLLVRASMERLRRRDSRECFLEVRASNLAAQRLYEAEGFATIGRRKRYYSKPAEDAIVMRLRLF
jgi:[ribosomal protein S18]-alanine N-acetyltransferase